MIFDMESVKYIPGDLVTTDGIPFGTKKGLVYKVEGSEPSYTVTLDNGKVLRGKVILNNLESTKVGDDGYLFGTVGAWEKNIIPIPLTKEVLGKNEWSKNDYGVYFKFFNPKMVVSLIKRSDDSWNVIVGSTTLIYCKFIHEFQHLLFGLGLNSELKV